MVPSRGRPASANIACTALAPVSPSKSLMEPATLPVTASLPKKKPETAIAIAMMGPNEKTE
jgi:hypothetical protein